MSQRDNFDLVERCFTFAKNVRDLVRGLTKSIANTSDARQLVRSSGSIGANYIEANEALSRKDFIHRLKIARKEAKESVFWLRLLYIEDGSDLESHRTALVQEAEELKLILSAIIRKSSME